jgi:hypothetical protein
MPLVTAGSGVAIGLPQNWLARGLLPANAKAGTLAPAQGYQAVVSGSCSVATNAQVLDWQRQGKPSWVVDPLAIAAGADVVTQALAWATPQLASQAVLIYATAEPDAVTAIQSQLGVARAGELVEHALSEIAKGLVKAGVRQLVVAGGETSGAVVQALDVQRMVIGPQIDPGVPWTTVSSPVCDGDTVHVALKSGNFGSTDFFSKSLAMLKAI